MKELCLSVLLAVTCLLWIPSPSLAVRPQLPLVLSGDVLMDADMDENLCAITFDDGPSIYTPHLLDMLEQYGVRATFFMLGRNVRYYPEIVDRVADAGHEIGVHTYTHPNLRRLSYEKQLQEIESTVDALRDRGVIPALIRPPYGNFDERTKQAAEKLGLSIVIWSLDSLDWKRLPENYARIPAPNGKPYETGTLRGVFLFHDIHKRTVDDLPRIIAQLKAGGCQRFVTVSEYMAGLPDPEPPLLMTRRPDISHPVRPADTPPEQPAASLPLVPSADGASAAMPPANAQPAHLPAASLPNDAAPGAPAADDAAGRKSAGTGALELDLSLMQPPAAKADSPEQTK